jgi:hypothetical protein
LKGFAAIDMRLSRPFAVVRAALSPGQEMSDSRCGFVSSSIGGDDTED